ncbi:hypothetical protein RB195_021217 [Necator americanus]
MDRPETERDRTSPTSPQQERSSGFACSSSRSSQRSYTTESAKQKERKSSRDSLFSRVEARRVRDHTAPNSANRSRSRSDSRTPPHSARNLQGRRHREDSRSRSPSREQFNRLARYRDGREDPRPCRCIGIFGMNVDTSERDLENIFQEFGEIDYIKIVRDHVTGRSRGFGFVYYLRTRDAAAAKAELKDARIDGMRVRVDFSVTNGAPGYRGTMGRQKRVIQSSKYT